MPHVSAGHDRTRWRFCLLLGFAVFLWLLAARVTGATPLYPCENERFGFAVITGIQHFDVAPLHAGWYVNWGTARQAAHPAAMDFYQIVKTSVTGYRPSGPALLSIVDQNPGSVWLIGNEPDAPVQDNVPPDVYVQVYHDAYAEIKGRDPRAQVAISGMVQATPLRMRWLDRVWQGYQDRYGTPMPVDIWNVHAFVLREVRPGFGTQCVPNGGDQGDWGAWIPPGLTANCGRITGVDELDRIDLLKRDILRFRTWMKDHGQQNKELIVSEYGILFPEDLGYDYARVRDYMVATFDYFRSATSSQVGYPADGDRLVQRWNWYSLDDISFMWGTTHGALMDPTTHTMRPLGTDFANYTTNLLGQCSPYVDLQPSSMRTTNLGLIPYGQQGIVRLELTVRNQGNTASAPTQARFWDGDPDAGGTLLGAASVPTVPARYQGTVLVTFGWNALALGSHLITAEVDSPQISESREDNNRISLQVDFKLFRQFLPVAIR